MEKMRISMPILVEGKYDKNTLSQYFDADIFYFGGFSVFNAKEKQAMIRKIAKDGIIILCDSDGAGKQLRSFLTGILPKDKVYNAYVPKIEGKEKRKTKPSKAGLLGVEGMGRDELVKALSPFVDGGGRDKLSGKNAEKTITKVDLYLDGLSGTDGAGERRAKLLSALDLPDDMTANAMLSALNIIVSYDEYKSLVLSLDGGKD